MSTPEQPPILSPSAQGPQDPRPDAVPGEHSTAAIWAQDSRGLIGVGGTMAWDIPAEFAHFRRTTLGATVVMGRLTWESLPTSFRPLPKRHNVVLTSRADYDAPGAQVVSTVEQAAAVPSATGTTWVMGGGAVYEAMLPVCDRLVVTEIDLDVAAGLTADPVTGELPPVVHAPRLDPAQWELHASGPWQEDAQHPRWRVHTWTRRSR